MTTDTVKRTIADSLAAERAVVTPESLRAAQLFQLTERRKLEQDFGFKFDPFRDGQLLRDRRKK